MPTSVTKPLITLSGIDVIVDSSLIVYVYRDGLVLIKTVREHYRFHFRVSTKLLCNSLINQLGVWSNNGIGLELQDVKI